ncbi:MAG: branched-chain amino acid ABC transporter permease [Pseudomonadota bacterium]
MSDATVSPPAAARWRPAMVGLGLLCALAVVPLVAEVYGGAYLTSLAVRAMILATIAISLDFLIGRCGLVSFGHSAFVAIGAYATGILIENGTYDLPTILLTALASAALFAAVSGAISLRTSGVYFIMITLAFGQMVFFALGSLSRYGADDGLTLWFSPEIFGSDALMASDAGLYLVVLGLLVVTWVGADRLAGARFGRVLQAARQNPTRVETMGYSVFSYRLTAYVIAGIVAALAGVLWASHAQFISPALASWQRSGDLIAMVVLGGIGSRNGALVGAVFFVVLEEVLSTITHDWRLIFGPLLVVVALYARGGLADILDRIGQKR